VFICTFFQVNHGNDPIPLDFTGWHPLWYFHNPAVDNLFEFLSATNVKFMYNWTAYISHFDYFIGYNTYDDSGECILPSIVYLDRGVRMK